ncbi:MAG: hypothetical protein ACI92S_004981 [Planctomycetaceae bacterium]
MQVAIPVFVMEKSVVDCHEPLVGGSLGQMKFIGQLSTETVGRFLADGACWAKVIARVGDDCCHVWTVPVEDQSQA